MNTENSKLLMNIQRALDQSAIVAITDPKGNITYVNDKFCQISMFSADELIGQNHRLINSGHHSPDFFVNLWKTISSGQVWEGEIRNRTKFNTYYWVHTWIIPFLDDSGKPYEFVSIRYDITNRKEAENKNQIYSEKLEAKNKELELFASIAAHDLQEPLRKLLFFSDRLKTSKLGIDEESKIFVQKIENSAKRMQTLIDDLLTYSKVNMQVSYNQPVDLNIVLKNVEADLEVALAKASGKLVFENLPTLEGDPVQMHQLFMNLISNAIKFHRDNVSPLIKVSSQIVESHAEIVIEDNGIGIPEEYFDQIFGVFQRLNGKSDYAGNGMGLSICKRIVEKHHGTITLKSEVGIGTKFIIHLPLLQVSS